MTSSDMPMGETKRYSAKEALNTFSFQENIKP